MHRSNRTSTGKRVGTGSTRGAVRRAVLAGLALGSLLLAPRAIAEEAKHSCKLMEVQYVQKDRILHGGMVVRCAQPDMRSIQLFALKPFGTDDMVTPLMMQSLYVAFLNGRDVVLIYDIDPEMSQPSFCARNDCRLIKRLLYAVVPEMPKLVP